jgi:hypothetical protein
VAVALLVRHAHVDRRGRAALTLEASWVYLWNIRLL